MTQIDPLSNIGTTRVFRELCFGPKNPKNIADALKIKSPPVIEQLRRLQKIGLVKLGEKIGRIQNYEIEWRAFFELFFEKAFSQKLTHVEKERHKLEQLVTNKYFKKFIQLYVCQVAGAKNKITLLDSMSEFENGLLHSTFYEKSRKFDDDDLEDFFDKMQLWHKRARESMSYCELVFQDSTARIFNPERFKQ